MWHNHELEAVQMMNARLDYSLKICIMNASPYSPTKQRCERESNAKLRKASQQNAGEKYAGYNCQILSQGLKGTGQSSYVKSDMLFRICSQERIQGCLHKHKSIQCIKLYWCGKFEINCKEDLKWWPSMLIFSSNIDSLHPKANKINHLYAQEVMCSDQKPLCWLLILM